MRPANSSEERSRILLIDDDPKMCRLIRDYLAPMGYDVTIALTGAQGLETIASRDFQAVILDVMLPGLDGFEVLRRIRAVSTVPVLMLTARGDETDRIVGLEMGADDYLPKTFSTRELLARLRAVTRRSKLNSGETNARGEGELVVSDLVIRPAERRATVGDRELDLTPLEFDTLVCLARSAGRVLTRDRLLEEISGRSYDVFDRSVDVHISALRRKLGDDPKNPRYIKTLRSVGYMLLRNADE